MFADCLRLTSHTGTLNEYVYDDDMSQTCKQWIENWQPETILTYKQQQARKQKFPTRQYFFPMYTTQCTFCHQKGHCTPVLNNSGATIELYKY